MKTKNIIAAIFIAGSILTLSCNKKLELTNPNAVAEQDFFRTEADALIGLNGVLDGFQRGYTTTNWYRQTDRLTDNMTTINNTDGWLDMQNSGHSPVTPAVGNFWTTFYTIVSRANYVIDKVSNMEAAAISDDSRKRIIAEASFLRDWIYLDLTMHWGAVPLYTKPNGPFDAGGERSAREEIFSFMIDDLTTNVIPNLPATVSVPERGRIVQDAAKYLLGKYQLYDQQWAAAASTMKQIIDGGRWSLHPNFMDLFTLNGEFSKENLWEIVYETGGVDNGENFSVQIDTSRSPIVPNSSGRPIDNYGNSFLCSDGKPWLTNTIYGARSPLAKTGATRYLDRDPRLYATVFYFGELTPGGKKLWNYNNNANAVNNLALKKYFMVTSTQFNGGPQNYYMIRYADVLLMYAEAKNEAAGPDASVLAATKLVRNRVSMPEYPVGLSQADMRQYIRDERRWEFGGEHSRYFDLKRWNLLHVLPPAAKNNAFSNPRDYLLPYPQLEMDNNQNMKKDGQNPGW